MKQHPPIKHSPRTSCRVPLVLYLSTESKKKSKASKNLLRRVRSRQIADFKSYEIRGAVSKQMGICFKWTSFKAAKSDQR